MVEEMPVRRMMKTFSCDVKFVLSDRGSASGPCTRTLETYVTCDTAAEAVEEVIRRIAAEFAVATGSR